MSARQSGHCWGKTNSAVSDSFMLRPAWSVTSRSVLAIPSSSPGVTRSLTKCSLVQSNVQMELEKLFCAC